MEAYSLTTVALILLYKFQIKISKAPVDTGTPYLKATILHITVKYSDKPFGASEIHGQFIIIWMAGVIYLVGLTAKLSSQFHYRKA